MTRARIAARFPVLTLILAAGFPTFGQSVVSTHSGVVYFFTGSAFLGSQPLEQKFGRFPDIGEGGELRTALGRAEVLLTPGVFLRLDQNSSIRMLSTSFADTRVQLLSGSAILEVTETSPNMSVVLLYRSWQLRAPQKGLYRIDSEPPKVSVYQGSANVTADAARGSVTVGEGETLPLAEVLVPETSAASDDDDFKYWSGIRSQAISADNTIAAGIVDDPGDVDASGAMGGGGGGAYSYFPLTSVPYIDVASPYGLSFWSPFQPAFNSLYFSPYPYGFGAMYLGSRVAGRPYPGRPLFPPGIRRFPPRTGLPSRSLAPSVHVAPRIGGSAVPHMAPVGAHR